MSNSSQQMADALRATFADKLDAVTLAYDEVNVDVAPENLIEVASGLRDDKAFRFDVVDALNGF